MIKKIKLSLLIMLIGLFSTTSLWSAAPDTSKKSTALPTKKSTVPDASKKSTTLPNKKSIAPETSKKGSTLPGQKKAEKDEARQKKKAGMNKKERRPLMGYHTEREGYA